MSRLPITIADLGFLIAYALLTDGRVQVEGCDVNYITMPVKECFERAYFHGEFEVAEIGFSPSRSHCARGPTPYVALPVFLSRRSGIGGLCPQRPRRPDRAPLERRSRLSRRDRCTGGAARRADTNGIADFLRRASTRHHTLRRPRAVPRSIADC